MSVLPIPTVINAASSPYTLQLTDFTNGGDFINGRCYIPIANSVGALNINIPSGLGFELFNALPPSFKVDGFQLNINICEVSTGNQFYLTNSDSNILNTNSPIVTQGASLAINNWESKWILINSFPLSTWSIYDVTANIT